MLVTVLTSGIKKTPYGALLALGVSLIMLILVFWVTFGLWPQYGELIVLAKHNKNLTHRIASLHKRTKRSDAVEQKLTKMFHLVGQLSRALPQSNHEGICQLLESIHFSGMRLITWKPGPKKEYLYGVEQLVLCELQGSYEEFYELINSYGGFSCKTCTITHCAGDSRDLLVKACIGIFFRKEHL